MTPIDVAMDNACAAKYAIDVPCFLRVTATTGVHRLAANHIPVPRDKRRVREPKRELRDLSTNRDSLGKLNCHPQRTRRAR